MLNFYLPSSGQVIPADLLYVNTGFQPTYDPGLLASNGIYTINETPDPYDPELYVSEATYTLAGNYANQSWVSTARPLATAQANGIVEVKSAAGDNVSAVLSANNVTGDVMTSVAGQLIGDRPASLQTILAEMQVVTDLLGAQIAAINAATTVDEINDIVNPVAITGSIDINRTGNNLDESFVTSLTGCDPEKLSLYFNSTAITVAYSTGSSSFPATPSVFSGGDFTGKVLYLGIYELASFDATTTPLSVPFNWAP